MEASPLGNLHHDEISVRKCPRISNNLDIPDDIQLANAYFIILQVFVPLLGNIHREFRIRV